MHDGVVGRLGASLFGLGLLLLVQCWRALVARCGDLPGLAGPVAEQPGQVCRQRTWHRVVKPDFDAARREGDEMNAVVQVARQDTFAFGVDQGYDLVEVAWRGRGV